LRQVFGLLSKLSWLGNSSINHSTLSYRCGTVPDFHRSFPIMCHASGHSAHLKCWVYLFIIRNYIAWSRAESVEARFDLRKAQATYQYYKSSISPFYRPVNCLYLLHNRNLYPMYNKNQVISCYYSIAQHIWDSGEEIRSVTNKQPDSCISIWHLVNLVSFFDAWAV
jgi:hypothetical protein